MFAIRTIIEDRLYALAIEDEYDVFYECFDNWSDTSYLYQFFSDRPQALSYYEKGKKEAAKLIIKEAAQFFEDVLRIAQNPLNTNPLDHFIFEPLHSNQDFSMPFVQSKAYGTDQPKSFLRLYAVRLQDGAYVVAGGIIKTTEALQDCDEGKAMLKTLKQLGQFLQNKNLNDAFDLGTITI